MAQNKFLTIDLATGKKILKNLEAALVKFDPAELSAQGITGQNLQEALKEEVLRAYVAEQTLDAAVKKAVKDAETADKAIKALIGEIPEMSTVKQELDRIERLVTTLESKVDTHIANRVSHIEDSERTKWNKAITDLAQEKLDRASEDSRLEREIATKADEGHNHVMADITDLSAELAKKIDKTEIIEDGKFKTELLPSLAINETKIVRTAQEAMEAQIQNGDVVIINPSHVETYAASLSGLEPTTGTFICVDITAETFEERFRLLYSHTDAISKAEVQAAIAVEKQRAEEAEARLKRELDNEKNEGQAGSLAYKIKANADAITAEVERAQGEESRIAELVNSEAKRAKAEEAVIKQSVTTEKERAEAAENEIRGLVTAEETAREEADTALDGKINELSGKVDKLSAEEKFTVALKASLVSVGDLLTIKSEDGSVVKATTEDDNVVGIAVEVTADDVKTAIMGKVDVSGFMTLTAGKEYFLGDDGRISTVCPQATGKHIIKVGKALSTTELLVKIEEAIEIL